MTTTPRPTFSMWTADSIKGLLDSGDTDAIDCFVRAVNTFDEARAALRMANLVMARGDGLSYADRREAHEAIQAVLAKMEGEQ